MSFSVAGKDDSDSTERKRLGFDGAWAVRFPREGNIFISLVLALSSVGQPSHHIRHLCLTETLIHIVTSCFSPAITKKPPEEFSTFVATDLISLLLAVS